MTRSIAFCVDDLGLLEGVAETVVALAAEGRISSASCIVSAPACRGEVSEAATGTRANPGFELGLHFNLTEGSPVSPDLTAAWPTLPRLERLIADAHLGRLPLAALGIELQAQIDAFTEAVGRPPAYLDGHQHVHALPGIRDRVLAAAGDPAIRNTGHVVGPGFGLKRMLIERTGGRALQARLAAHGRRCNTALLGVYDFASGDYRGLMRGWIGAAPDAGALLFCHPSGSSAGSGRDSIGGARRREAAYLGSAAFADDLAEAGFTVGPAWQSSSAG